MTMVCLRMNETIEMDEQMVLNLNNSFLFESDY